MSVDRQYAINIPNYQSFVTNIIKKQVTNLAWTGYDRSLNDVQGQLTEVCGVTTYVHDNCLLVQRKRE